MEPMLLRESNVLKDIILRAKRGSNRGMKVRQVSDSRNARDKKRPPHGALETQIRLTRDRITK